MRSQRLCIVGLVLPLFLFVYGCGSSATGGGTTPTSNANALIVDSKLSTLKIEADIPPMEVKHQVIVTVSLYPTGGPISVSQVKIVPNATAVVTNATPVGTPGNTLVDAFGPGHSVVATATLETSTVIFSVVPAGPQPKPLDQERVEWTWFVTPLVDGDQSIGVDIEAQWTSTINGKQSLPYTLGFPRFPVKVQALPTPTPTPVAPAPTPTPPQPSPPDPLTTFIAIMTLLAAVLVPFIVVYITVPSFRRWVKRPFRRSKNRGPTEPGAPP